jgi:hypothetical protein
MPADLFKNSLLEIQSAGFIIFCLTFIPGCFFISQPLMYAGIISLLITAAMYLANVFIILFHKTITYGKL